MKCCCILWHFILVLDVCCSLVYVFLVNKGLINQFINPYQYTFITFNNSTIIACDVDVVGLQKMSEVL